MAFLSSFSARPASPGRAANSRGLLIAPGLELVCLITEVSNAGVRVRMDRALSLPRQMLLVDVAAGTVCEAEVASSRGLEASLKCVTRTTPLRGLVPARLTPARDAWLRAGGR